MGPDRRRCSIARWLLIGAGVLLLSGVTLPAMPQDVLSPKKQEPSDPTLEKRPAPKPSKTLIPEGKIKLDVVVSDGAGKPVTGLQPWDFKILDNNQPRRVMSFKTYDGIQVMPNPPVQAILVIDTVNLPFSQVAFVRQQVDQFLRQDGGHLKLPTTLGLLTDAGVRFQSRPSTDGNSVASVVDGIQGHVSSINSAMGGDGMVERFQLSVRNIAMIAENEAQRPGRKLLIWVGPGWPMLNRPSGSTIEREQKRWFDSIVELSTRLREGQIAVYSVAPQTGSSTYALMYQAFVKGVPMYQQADSGNLALKVLVKQTAGLALGPDNNLVNQLNRCVDDANAYYRISFDPPPAGHEDEYHDLKVVVDKPGAVVRTSAGYYNEPPGS